MKKALFSILLVVLILGSLGFIIYNLMQPAIPAFTKVPEMKPIQAMLKLADNGDKKKLLEMSADKNESQLEMFITARKQLGKTEGLQLLRKTGLPQQENAPQGTLYVFNEVNEKFKDSLFLNIILIHDDKKNLYQIYAPRYIYKNKDLKFFMEGFVNCKDIEITGPAEAAAWEWYRNLDAGNLEYCSKIRPSGKKFFNGELTFDYESQNPEKGMFRYLNGAFGKNINRTLLGITINEKVRDLCAVNLVRLVFCAERGKQFRTETIVMFRDKFWSKDSPWIPIGIYTDKDWKKKPANDKDFAPMLEDMKKKFQ